MRSRLRVGLATTFTLVTTVGLVVAGAQLPATAAQEPSPSPSTTSTSPAAPASGSEAAPTAAPTAQPTTTPTPDAAPATPPAAAPDASAPAAPAPTAAAPGSTVAADPALAEMNAARNHSMGSTFSLSGAAADAAAGNDAGSQARTFSAAATTFPPGVRGLDVSGWQTNINWNQVWADGGRFAYIKATEDLDYKSSQFSTQYSGAYNVGIIRGAYHFATPNTSSGAAQARFFVQNGGGWSADGRTLPPLLDIEFNPYGGSNTCWGLSAPQMVAWVADFVNTVTAMTGIAPAIYTNTNWWNLCTGGSAAFGAYPLFVANYSNISTPPLPPGWGSYTIWQFANGVGPFPGDQDVFNGSLKDLQAFALGNRLAGADAFGTSAALSSTFSPGVPVAYVASGYNYADALAGGPAAGKQRGPVLLVQPYGVPDVIATELKRLRPARIVVLGGPTAISDGTVSALRAYTSGGVTRLAGSDRFETSVAVSKSAFGANPSVAYIATGMNFPDALTGASVAAGSAHSGPLLLVTSVSIPPSVAGELQRLRPGKIVVLGGTDAINTSVEAALKSYTSGSVTRISGDDRYITSAKVSQANFAPGVAAAYIAVGTNFPDALSGAPVAGIANAPVLLTQSTAIPQSIAAELTRLKPKKIVILGGSAAVSASVAAALNGYVVK
ncbi:cell wall-binding repeat-containing protein [Leifsonia sp. PS1209]|uniref:cell wall-binding repeat-containing protein n=1 Tax=Leifsonia sp. PS1209 TaxID=2724914 RepID=UPI001442B52E|nr:cell wall-binding repeat-containing protein [Leifsonia sp. PS1209]QIZ98891.1 hypothetical protein HF024_10500 [Leifsonia sp. PS1209]